MRWFDVTKGILTENRADACPPPVFERTMAIGRGECCNYSLLHASVHTSTHCDAYLHFVDGQADIAQMPLTHYLGECRVLTVAQNALLTDADLRGIPEGTTRLLLRGGENTYVSAEGAKYLRRRGIITVGTEACSIGCGEADTPVHTELLAHHIAIIENLCLRDIRDGIYFLSAAPCKFTGAEAAFCRAVLLDGLPDISGGNLL